MHWSCFQNSAWVSLRFWGLPNKFWNNLGLDVEKWWVFPRKASSVQVFPAILWNFVSIGSDHSVWIGNHKISGWWLSPTPLKNDEVKVSWDYDIPKIWKNQSHVPNHQPEYIFYHISHQISLLWLAINPIYYGKIKVHGSSHHQSVIGH